MRVADTDCQHRQKRNREKQIKGKKVVNFHFIYVLET